MKKIVPLTVLVFLLAGCGSLKQGWNNFTAYYNTFYNAKKFYNRGLDKNQAQVPDINPLQPIRVHPSPTDAGLDDFEKAIEKGGAILRSHDDSKYVAPALFIIGKSYYYRSEFFAALEKFQELETIASGEDRNRAIIWEGLTYREMTNFADGIELLEFELNEQENWTPETLANARVVLAELHVALENWETASQYLEDAMSALQDHEKKARAFFLLGQVFERMDDVNRALFAYRQVSTLRTSFDLAFNGTRKEAQMSRQVGNYDYAVQVYQSIRRDDKFIDYRADLQYEIARTLQLKGDHNAAIQNYDEVLSARAQPPSNQTRAKTYYALGEIYRDHRHNLKLAAAYFDSAASQRVEPALISDDFDARELADSFGEYVSIKQSISEKDSLLNLAAMEPEELDRFVEELRQKELKKMEQELEQMQQQRNQMLVVDREQEIIDADEVTEYGFLNIESPTRLADASLQFQAVWGDRPLTDNWRRRAAVSGSRFDQVSEAEEETSLANGSNLSATGIQPAIDLSAIPFEEEEKQQMKTEIEALQYRLGNVFFLSLEMPDSARTYYRKVIDSGYDKNLVTKSLYSLAELELLSGNREEAIKWYERLTEKNNGSQYAGRIAERLGLEPEIDQQESETGLQPENNIVLQVDSLNSLTESEQTADLIKLADSSGGEEIRPYLLFNAAKNYMTVAKNQPGFKEEIENWFRKQQKIEEKREEFRELQDSSRVMLSDSSLTEEQQQYWQQIADSSFSKPEISAEFPFEGAYWDSTRSLLQEIENQYATSTIMPQVQILRETLAAPTSDSSATEEIPRQETETDPRAFEEERTASYQRCGEAGVSVDLEGGIERFMNSLSYPSWTEDVTMRGELEYLFNIGPDGSIRSYEQLSRMDRSGIPQSVENGFETSLKFTPPPSGESVQCTVVFPIDL